MAQMSPSTALELVTDAKLEQANDARRSITRELVQTKERMPNNPITRLIVALTAANTTTYADTMIGDGKGDGVKVGSMIAGGVTAVAAWKAGKYTVAHGAMDAVIGIACAQSAIASKEAGLKAALAREQKRAKEQAAQPQSK